MSLSRVFARVLTLKLIMSFTFPVLLASQNQNKCEEFAQLLPQLLVAQPFDCEEVAATYFGNALLKARAVQVAQPGNWVLADDSGLEVAALGGRPGIYSARYGGEGLGAEERNAMLLEELGDTAERRARFVCCLTLLSPNDQLYAVQSCILGKISTEPRSKQEQVFGYDPIFELPEYAGQTFAQLNKGFKQKLSHRSLACARLGALLRT